MQKRHIVFIAETKNAVLEITVSDSTVGGRLVFKTFSFIICNIFILFETFNN